MTDSGPSPDKIMQLISGSWSTAILGAAATHGIFNVLESGASAAQVAQKCTLAPRGAQALLDGLLGLGLITLENQTYRNTPESSTFLVEGKPAWFGGLARWGLSTIARWGDLGEVAQTGIPKASDTADVADNPFWEVLVPSIAVLSFQTAQAAAERLGLAKAGPIAWLDVGGGSGVYSAVWLGANPKARATQLDWANVNKIARGFVARFGGADRFGTIDGDFHTTDFGSGLYDVAIYSHIAHQESPASNLAVFKKFRRALKPGGTLLISDFVLNDDRTGHPFTLLFTANMLLHAKEGATYRQKDYRAWLNEAGFPSVTIEPTPGAASLIYAR
ncbi:MAG TPA: methyltransferase [Planctomycetota bacterium]|nr:methyltransferase [Planctomycetota bacterium]